MAVLNVDMDVVAQLLDEKYSAKKALKDSNDRALRLGFDYAKKHFEPLPFHLEKMDANGDKILIDGNTATALGCVYAGATVAAWYPITPSTSVMDAFKELLRQVPPRQRNQDEQLPDPSGRRRAGGDRHGDRRFVDRRASVHLHLRARAFR